jgi:hypothetical protein
MDNTFPRKDDKVFAIQWVVTLPIVAIVLFSLGAVQFTRHHQYRNVATGNQIGIHVDAGSSTLQAFKKCAALHKNSWTGCRVSAEVVNRGAYHWLRRTRLYKNDATHSWCRR